MRRLGLAVRIAVSAGLLYWVLSEIDFGRLAAIVRELHPAVLAAALGVYFLAVIVVGAVRWRLLLASQGVAVPMGFLVESYLVATFWNNVLPTNIGGDVFRIKDAARYTRSKTLATAVVFVDRLLGFAALFVLALGAVALGGPAVRRLPGLDGLWAGLAAVTLAALVVLLVPEIVRGALGPLRRLGSAWVDERVGVVTSALFRFRRKLPAVAAALGVSLLIQASLVVFYYLTARAMAIPLPLGYCFLVTPLVLLVQLFPSINGFGVRESALVFFFRVIGLAAEQAVSLSFVSTALVVLLSLGGGVLYALRPGRARTAPAPKA